VAVAPSNGRQFISLNISQAFILADLVKGSSIMPISPFELNHRELKKKIILRLVNREGINNEIMHIHFSPTKNSRSFFEGDVWIVERSSKLLKLDFHIKNAERHPFVPAHAVFAKIENVEIHFEKSYHIGSYGVRPLKTNFSYNFTYRPNRSNPGTDSILKVSSKAVVTFFEPGDLFIDPYFQYSENLTDYQKIAGLTYNDRFWENQHSFMTSQSMQKKLQYFVKNGSVFNYSNTNITKIDKDSPLLANNYILWSNKKRIAVKSGYISRIDSNEKFRKPAVQHDLYNLKVQIYLDANLNGDRIEFMTVTVLDVYQSYCNLEPTPLTNCFINLYFDLCEIKRLSLAGKINELNNINQIDSLYKVEMKNLQVLCDDYLNEVNMGRNWHNLQKWNQTVKDELQIDNIQIFSVQENRARRN
jgi:hypothetical protein